MSKDMLGPLPRALVGVPKEFQPILLDAANKLSLPDGERYHSALASALREEKLHPKKQRRGCLEIVPTHNDVVIPPTSGLRNIANSVNVFNEIDEKFDLDRVNVTSAPTDSQKVTMLDLIEDASYATMFGCHRYSLRDFCFSQDQIVTFAEKFRTQLLPAQGNTLFLFRPDSRYAEYFIAMMAFKLDGSLAVWLRNFDSGGQCHAQRHRIVLPIQA
ncbi:MAG: hypothetical protein Q7S52_05465 [bacterium]|nr:hypothetical protein [bacterium]